MIIGFEVWSIWRLLEKIDKIMIDIKIMKKNPKSSRVKPPCSLGTVSLVDRNAGASDWPQQNPRLFRAFYFLGLDFDLKTHDHPASLATMADSNKRKERPGGCGQDKRGLKRSKVRFVLLIFLNEFQCWTPPQMWPAA
jgi:hypothetical protein